MLVLTRRENERVVLPTINTSIQVVRITGSTVRLGIDAPANVPVFREELLREGEGVARPAGNGNRSGSAPSPNAPVNLQQVPVQGADSLVKDYEKLLDCLALAFDLAETHLARGRIDEARETLDRARGHIRRVLARQPSTRLPKSKVCSGRVALVIEPPSDQNNSLSRVLREAGYSVVSFASGCQAIDYLATHGRPNLIIINLHENRPCAADAIRAIRKNPALRGVKVVALGDAQPAEVEISIGPHGVDYWFSSQTRPESILEEIEA
jgi:carbon storage regulator CsrA